MTVLWTPEDKSMLKEMAGVYSANAIAKRLGCTKRAVLSLGERLQVNLELEEHLAPFLRSSDHRLAKKAKVPLREWATKKAGGFKWCQKCSTWKEHDDFWVDKHKASGRGACCKDCSRKTHKRRWAPAEKKKLFQLVGTYTAVEMAGVLGRSPGSIRQFCKRNGLSLRLNSDQQFSYGQFRELMQLSQSTHDDWLQNGLAYRTSSRGYHMVTKKALQTFLRTRPEAFDVYTLSEESLETLGIDLKTWPEAPNFKLLRCDGYVHRIHNMEVRHHNVWICRLLHETRSFCPVCNCGLKKWAVAYTNTWVEGLTVSDELPEHASLFAHGLT